MISILRAQEKLWEYAVSFSKHCAVKNWAKAKYCYTTARNIAVFLELEEEEMIELFGSREDPGRPVEGLFKEQDVIRALRECIKKDK